MKSLKVIKEGIINKNEEVCVENLKILFLENKHNFTNTLLKSNILPEPISYKTKNEDIEFCNKLFTRLAIELLNHDDVTINDINIITGFKLALYTIFKGIRINAKLLENNEISKMTSYAEKIKIPLVYLQYNSYMLTKVREKEKLTEKNFITFREGEIKTVGTDIDKIMPPVSRFGGGNRTKKKQTVIDKLKSFFEKYFGVGDSAKFSN